MTNLSHVHNSSTQSSPATRAASTPGRVVSALVQALSAAFRRAGERGEVQQLLALRARSIRLANFDPQILQFSLNLCLLRRGILLLSSSKIEVASANRCKIMCWKHLFDYSPQVVRLELKIPKTENGSTATPSEFSGVEHTFTTKGYVLAFIHLWVRGLVGARGGTRGTFPLVGAGVFSPWLGLRHYWGQRLELPAKWGS